eukprot:PhF_6_TR40767/c0_g1_i1/m.61461
MTVAQSEIEDFRFELSCPNVSLAMLKISEKFDSISLPISSEDIRSHKILQGLTLHRHLPSLCNALFGKLSDTLLSSTNYTGPDGVTRRCWMDIANANGLKSGVGRALTKLLSPSSGLVRVMQHFSQPTPDNTFFWVSTRPPNYRTMRYEEYTFDFPVYALSEQTRTLLSEIDGTAPRDVSKLPPLLQIPFYTPPFKTFNKSISHIPMNMWAYFMFRLAAYLNAKVFDAISSAKKKSTSQDTYSVDIVDQLFLWVQSFFEKKSVRVPYRYVSQALGLSEVYQHVITEFIALARSMDKVNPRTRWYGLVTFHAFHEVWLQPIKYERYEVDRAPVPYSTPSAFHLYSCFSYLLNIIPKAYDMGEELTYHHEYITLLRGVFLVSDASDILLKYIPIGDALDLWLSYIQLESGSEGGGRSWQSWSQTPYILHNYDMYAMPLDDFLYFLKASQVLRVCELPLAQKIFKVLSVYTNPTLHELLCHISAKVNEDIDLKCVLQNNCKLNWCPASKVVTDRFVVCPVFTSLTAQRAALVALSLRNMLTPEIAKNKMKGKAQLVTVLQDIYEILTNEEVFPGVNLCLQSVASPPRRSQHSGSSGRSGSSGPLRSDVPMTMSNADKRDVWNGRRDGIDPLRQPAMYFSGNNSVALPDYLCGVDDVPFIFNTLMNVAWWYANRELRERSKSLVRCRNGHAMCPAEEVRPNCTKCEADHISWGCPACDEVYCSSCAETNVLCHTLNHGMTLTTETTLTVCPLCRVQIRINEPLWKCEGGCGILCRMCCIRRPPSRRNIRIVHFLASSAGAVLIGISTGVLFFGFFLLFLRWWLF